MAILGDLNYDPIPPRQRRGPNMLETLRRAGWTNLVPDHVRTTWRSRKPNHFDDIFVQTRHHQRYARSGGVWPRPAHAEGNAYPNHLLAYADLDLGALQGRAVSMTRDVRIPAMEEAMGVVVAVDEEICEEEEEEEDDDEDPGMGGRDGRGGDNGVPLGGDGGWG